MMISKLYNLNLMAVPVPVDCGFPDNEANFKFDVKHFLLSNTSFLCVWLDPNDFHHHKAQTVDTSSSIFSRLCDQYCETITYYIDNLYVLS